MTETMGDTSRPLPVETALPERGTAPGRPDSLPTGSTCARQARSGWRLADFGELWLYRELLYFLTWRDVKVRYKQTALGAAWAVLQPVLTMVVFTIFFGRLAGLAVGRDPVSGLHATSRCFRGSSSRTRSRSPATASSRTQHARHEGLLPAADPADRRGRVAASSTSRSRSVVLVGLMVVLRRRTPLAACSRCRCSSLLALRRRAGGRALALGAEREVPRRPATRSRSSPVWLFVTPVAYSASLVPEQWRVAVRAQPDGRRRRGLPLGAARRPSRARWAARDVARRRRCRAARRRPALTSGGSSGPSRT